MTSKAFVTLSNGLKMPSLGLGSWQSNAGEVGAAVKLALDAGYKHIDTAAMYQNEEEIGGALQEYFQAGKLQRQDVFITSKLWCSHNRPEHVEGALKDSLKKLKTDYVDLYLIHQPVTFNPEMTEQDRSVTVEDTWQGIAGVYKQGLTRAVGVSNFNEEQIERILKSSDVAVHSSQVELHLYFQQKTHVEFCKKHSIAVTAYAPIGSPGRLNFVLPNGRLMEWPVAEQPMANQEVLKLAKKYNKSPAQILLRHLLQNNIAVIPKSVTPKRIQENAQIFDFELTVDEVKTLNSQPQGSRFFLMDFMAGHPEDPWKSERPQ
ncbi:unnamed protein product [Bursaphelenchus xylophilus]|uniref:(pine wood nematode) hypothetical protein n=1 Tax=Bursaphelenchus xylophilus TaxID=6326 RepID=A0A1I7SC91_BURXY|nr:unnamed protein product [Bursaphelenchus xylophilus]CAG9094535.1 unnamed protein product [Bursaphelenchus xylophilus]